MCDCVYVCCIYMRAVHSHDLSTSDFRLTDSASLKPIWLSGTTCNITTARCSYTLPIGYGLSCNHSKDIVLYCYGPPTPAPPTSAPGTVPSPFYCLGSTDPPILSMIPCPQSICVVMPPQRYDIHSCIEDNTRWNCTLFV